MVCKLRAYSWNGTFVCGQWSIGKVNDQFLGVSRVFGSKFWPQINSVTFFNASRGCGFGQIQLYFSRTGKNEQGSLRKLKSTVRVGYQLRCVSRTYLFVADTDSYTHTMSCCSFHDSPEDRMAARWIESQCFGNQRFSNARWLRLRWRWWAWERSC